MLARSSKEPAVDRKGSSEGPADAAPSHLSTSSAPPDDAAPNAPEGGSGEWLQQYAWALEDGNLEQAASLLRWILAHAESWAVAQAADLAIERLAQVPEGKGAAAALVRLYNGLGPLFPEAHAFHGAFLEKLEAQVRLLAPGTQALTASQAIERALELFKSSLVSHASYASLRAALTEVQLKSHRVVQREKERELEGLLAAGEHEPALTLCRELVETYQSPLASGLMPALLAQAREKAERASAQLGRQARAWDWPEAQADDAEPTGLRINARTGRPINDVPGAPPDPEPPRAPWSKAFEAPPVVAVEDESPSDLPPALRGLMDGTAAGDGQSPSGRVAALPDLTSLPVFEGETETLNRPGRKHTQPVTDAAVDQTRADTPARVRRPFTRREWLWIILGGLLMASLVVAWLSAIKRSDDTPPAAGQKHAAANGSSASALQSARAEPSPAQTSTASPAWSPPAPADGPPAALTLEITPADRLELYLDGQLQPAGAVENLTVPAGHHTIEVYREEYEKYQQDAWATAGGETRIQIQLQKSPTLNLDVVPPEDVDIKLDGRRLSVSPPISNYVISPGKHRLEVSRDGFATRVEDFSATTGANLKFQLELKPQAN